MSRRRTMLAPIRPSPTMPTSILVFFLIFDSPLPALGRSCAAGWFGQPVERSWPKSGVEYTVQESQTSYEDAANKALVGVGTIGIRAADLCSIQLDGQVAAQGRIHHRQQREAPLSGLGRR